MEGEQKLPYETPALTLYGSFESVTQGTSSGSFTDAAFPIHTPVKDLTFS